MEMEEGKAGKLRLRALELLDLLQRRAATHGDVAAAIEWRTGTVNRGRRSSNANTDGANGDGKSKAPKKQQRTIPRIPNSLAMFACMTGMQDDLCVRELATPMGTMRTARIRMDDVRRLQLQLRLDNAAAVAAGRATAAAAVVAMQ